MKESKDSKIEISETKINISETDQHFINKLNQSLDVIRKESFNIDTSNFLMNNIKHYFIQLESSCPIIENSNN